MMSELRIQTNSLTFKWLAGILMAIVFALAAHEASTLTTAVDDVAKTQIINTAAISKIQGGLEQNAVRLQRIEANQDMVLQKLGALKR